MVNFTEKICICHTCSGPTYRKTALDKLNNIYFDDPNLCYSIITDDKEYFKDVKLKNIIVEELKDFYPDFPYLEKYEPFIESIDANDYAKKFVESDYYFSFAVMRFHLLHAKRFNCSNVALLCTDTTIKLDIINDDILNQKGSIYNQEGIWEIPSKIYKEQSDIVIELLKERHELKKKNEFLIYDAAGRLILFRDINEMNSFFNVWDDIVTTLFLTDKIIKFKGWVIYNDEYILAPIYSAFDIKKPNDIEMSRKMFEVKHDLEGERFWACD